MKAAIPVPLWVTVVGVTAWGGKARLSMYPEAGHDAWTATNPDLYDWFLGPSLQWQARTG